MENLILTAFRPHDRAASPRSAQQNDAACFYPDTFRLDSFKEKALGINMTQASCYRCHDKTLLSIISELNNESWIKIPV